MSILVVVKQFSQLHRRTSVLLVFAVLEEIAIADFINMLFNRNIACIHQLRDRLSYIYTLFLIRAFTISYNGEEEGNN